MIAFLLAMGMFAMAFKVDLSGSISGFKQGFLHVVAAFSLILSVVVGLLFLRNLSAPDYRYSQGEFGFRNGRLGVELDPFNPNEFVVTYREWSWFRFKDEGDWRAVPDGRDGWKYLEKGKWINVPEEVYTTYDSYDAYVER